MIIKFGNIHFRIILKVQTQLIIIVAIHRAMEKELSFNDKIKSEFEKKSEIKKHFN